MKGVTKMSLFVICGHGAGDCGAVGNGCEEAERVRALAQRIKALGGNNVIVGDTSKNWYASKLITTANIPKDAKILELHLDSSANISAKGGHVIIKKGLKADKYDNALASFIGKMFAGRSSLIVERSDLANPNRAHSKGYNYRLMECCFISNKDDIVKFNNNLDAIAKGILNAFEIPVSEPSETNKTIYRVQVGAFSKKENAERLVSELKSKGYEAFITK